jgi:hypothetical protein
MEVLVGELGAQPSTRALNVALAPDSAAHRRVRPARPSPSGHQPSAHLAPGFQPRPAWNLADAGGRTISELVFVNRYVGPGGAWSDADMASIDGALSKAMSDANLQTVIQQYYRAPISSRMLPSATHITTPATTMYKDTIEALAAELHAAGAIGAADPGSTVINILLPAGVVLSDDFSPGYVPPAGQQQSHAHRRAGVIKLDPQDAADSRHGLGGYHGSIHAANSTTVYYAAGVYSEATNGIAVFDQPWKNVVATFYHELNEARTDADVEDVNRTGNAGALGWYSQTGQGEIGDLPINETSDIHEVFIEAQLADGTGTVPIQLMWSNNDSGPAASTG